MEKLILNYRSVEFDINKLILTLDYSNAITFEQEKFESTFKDFEFSIRTMGIYSNWFSEHLVRKLKVSIDSINYDIDNKKINIRFKDILEPLPINESKERLKNSGNEEFMSIKNFYDLHNYEMQYGWSTYDTEYNAFTEICLVKKNSLKKPKSIININYIKTKPDYIPENFYKRLLYSIFHMPFHNMWSNMHVVRFMAKCENEFDRENGFNKHLRTITKEEVFELLKDYPFYYEDA